MQHFKKLSKITYVVSLGFCVYKSHLECQSLEIILDANSLQMEELPDLGSL